MIYRLRLRLPLRGEHGVTLIEMIMVLAILGTVLGGVTTVFVAGSRAELQVNNRFQAQEAARLAMGAVRADVHSACAVAVNGGNTVMTLSVPVTDRTKNPVVPAVPGEQCGTINAANIVKIIWVVCTSPTVSTQFAIYRATATTCPSTGKLVANNLINSLAGFGGFFKPTLMTAPVAWVGAINWGETQTVDVDIAVTLKTGAGGAGAPFDLKQRLALSNTVWSPGPAGTACSASVPCFPGPCDYTDPITLAPAPCFPAAIS